jgi:Ca-activated chloride channel family protein
MSMMSSTWITAFVLPTRATGRVGARFCQGTSIKWLALATLVVASAGCGTDIDSQEKAHEHIGKLVENKVDPTFLENQYRANIQLTKTNLLSMLPDLNEHPIALGAVEGPSIEVAEIFTSSEKAGTGRDGFYIELAEAFNSSGFKLDNGKMAAVAIRRMASGLGAQFIISGQYVPDGFSPSNLLWGRCLRRPVCGWKRSPR